MNSNFNISADDFNFTQKEIEVLFWIKYWSIKKFTPETTKGSESMTTTLIFGGPLFMLAGMAVNAAGQSIEKNRISKDYTKDRWCNEWSKVTRKLLNINNEISKSDVLSEFNALNISAGKKLAFIVELSTFSAYFPLNEGDSIYDGLKSSPYTQVLKYAF